MCLPTKTQLYITSFNWEKCFLFSILFYFRLNSLFQSGNRVVSMKLQTNSKLLYKTTLPVEYIDIAPFSATYTILI